MSLVAPELILKHQFLKQGDRRLRWSQVAFMLPGVSVGCFVMAFHAHLTAAAPLLTVRSIVSGGTFAMATTLWTRSVDARRSPAFSTNAAALNALDDARYHMLWTVTAGIATTGVLALTAIFGGSSAATWATAICAALLTYLITLVGVALMLFAEAAIKLR